MIVKIGPQILFIETVFVIMDGFGYIGAHINHYLPPNALKLVNAIPIPSVIHFNYTYSLRRLIKS